MQVLLRLATAVLSKAIGRSMGRMPLASQAVATRLSIGLEALLIARPHRLRLKTFGRSRRMDPGWSDEPAFDDRVGDQPLEQRAELVRQRRRWFWGEGYALVRMLQRFLLEAPGLAESLGYADTESLLRQGYGLDLVLGERIGLRFTQEPGVPSTRLCSCCGKAFSARRRDARYCSNSCRSRASRQRRRLDQRP